MKPISYVFGGVTVFEIKLRMGVNQNTVVHIAAKSAGDALELALGENLGSDLQTIKVDCKPMSYQKLRKWKIRNDAGTYGESYLKALHDYVKKGVEFPSIIAEDYE